LIRLIGDRPPTLQAISRLRTANSRRECESCPP
jgi:hypothetical protein